jgi:energy-coupling factor transport system ATP-binding protein
MLWLEDGRVVPYRGGTNAMAAGASADATVATGAAAQAQSGADVRPADATLSTSTDTSTDTAPCLAIRHLAYRVGGRAILEDIDFQVGRGERLVILGDNGCGKTTLLRLIARLQRPTRGTVEQHLDPALGARPSPAWYKKVGYVYQNPSYQLFMPQVFSEVAYQSPSQADTSACLEMFGLAALATRHSQALSEGQKRRLSIAAIVAQGPEVLLLDEPTVGQDDANLRLLIEALNRLHERDGLTLITVTHDYRAAIALGDKALWIQDGRVLKQGGREVTKAFFETTQRTQSGLLKYSVMLRTAAPNRSIHISATCVNGFCDCATLRAE